MAFSILFLFLILILAFLALWQGEKIDFKEFQWFRKGLFFASFFYFILLFFYTGLDRLNQINALEFTNESLKLFQFRSQTISVTLFSLLLGLGLFGLWKWTGGVSSSEYKKNSSWLPKTAGGLWLLINAGFILLMLDLI